MRRANRRGFSLLEVLLATGILVGSAIVLMELASIGTRHAVGARDESQLQRICQTKLNEIVIGAAPAEAVRPMPCEDEPHLTYWVNIESTPRAGLLKLEVSVAKDPNSRRPNQRFTLVRWIRDPKAARETSPAPSETQPGAQLAAGGEQP